MDARDRPDVAPLADGFVLVDRVQATTSPHTMRRRSGGGRGPPRAMLALTDTRPAVETAAAGRRLRPSGSTGDGSASWSRCGWMLPAAVWCAMLPPVSIDWRNMGHAA
jgi:hypothetical protein